jgi:hypothetical protein
MNLTIAPIPGKRQTLRLRRVSRVFAVLLGIILLTSAAAQAGPVRINQVVQTLSSLQGAPELTLISQDPVTTGTKGSTAQSGPRNDNAGSSDPKLDSLLSGFKITPAIQQIGIDIIEEGEVDGTICDCGEILIAGAGFPKWPFAFLAAVPLVFIDFDDDCKDCEQSTPTPTPFPSPSVFNTTPTPEPASLLLFGSGLVAFGAGLRHRYRKAKLGSQKTEEGESD